MKKNSKQPQGWPSREPDWLRLAARLTQTQVKDWKIAVAKEEQAPTAASVCELREKLAEEGQTLLREIALWGPGGLIAAGSIVAELLAGQRMAFLIARLTKQNKRQIIKGMRTPWPTSLVPSQRPKLTKGDNT